MPAQPAFMVLGGLATLAAMVIQPLGQVIARIARAFLEWTIVVAECDHGSLDFQAARLVGL